MMINNSNPDKFGLGIFLIALGMFFYVIIPSHVANIPTNMHNIGICFFVLGGITILYSVWVVWVTTHTAHKTGIDNNANVVTKNKGGNL